MNSKWNLSVPSPQFSTSIKRDYNCTDRIDICTIDRKIRRSTFALIIMNLRPGKCYVLLFEERRFITLLCNEGIPTWCNPHFVWLICQLAWDEYNVPYQTNRINNIEVSTVAPAWFQNFHMISFDDSKSRKGERSKKGFARHSFC